MGNCSEECQYNGATRKEEGTMSIETWQLAIAIVGAERTLCWRMTRFYINEWFESTIEAHRQIMDVTIADRASSRAELSNTLRDMVTEQPKDEGVDNPTTQGLLTLAQTLTTDMQRGRREWRGMSMITGEAMRRVAWTARLWQKKSLVFGLGSMYQLDRILIPPPDSSHLDKEPIEATTEHQGKVNRIYFTKLGRRKPSRNEVIWLCAECLAIAIMVFVK